MNLATATVNIGKLVRYHPLLGLKHDGNLYRLNAVERIGDEYVAWLAGKDCCVAIEALSPGPAPLIQRAVVSP